MTTIYSNIPDIAEIKSKFEAGDKPSEQDFYELIELAEVARTLAALNCDSNMKGLIINDQGILELNIDLSSKLFWKDDFLSTDNTPDLKDAGGLELIAGEVAVKFASSHIGSNVDGLYLGDITDKVMVGDGLVFDGNQININDVLSYITLSPGLDKQDDKLTIKASPADGNHLQLLPDGVFVRQSEVYAGTGINVEANTVAVKKDETDDNQLTITDKGLYVAEVEIPPAPSAGNGLDFLDNTYTVKKDIITPDNQLMITENGLYVAEVEIPPAPSAGNGLDFSDNTYAIGQGEGITVGASAITVKKDTVTPNNQLMITDKGLHVAKPASPIAGSGINIDNTTTTITLKLNTEGLNPLILTDNGLNIVISDDLFIEDLGDKNHQLAINWSKILDDVNHPLIIKIKALGLA